MRIIQGKKLDFDDVLIVPKRSTIVSRKDVCLTRQFKFKYSSLIWEGVPIISANMDTVTNIQVAQVMAGHKMLACYPKKAIVRATGDSIFSVGLNSEIPAEIFYSHTPMWFCLDAPNGYIEVFVERVVELRKRMPDNVLVAGNVVTPEMTEALILAGADVVKVGLGSGAACTTRLQTGIGFPQLSAVIECADAAHGLGGYIISDGGCRTVGDLAKAFGAGSDFIMLGKMLAGHTENGQEFYGMASKKAAEKHAGGLKEYRAAEGREMILPPKGPLHNTLQEIEGGLRSACAYVGSKSIKDLPKRTTFIRVTRPFPENGKI